MHAQCRSQDGPEHHGCGVHPDGRPVDALSLGALTGTSNESLLAGVTANDTGPDPINALSLGALTATSIESLLAGVTANDTGLDPIDALSLGALTATSNESLLVGVTAGDTGPDRGCQGGHALGSSAIDSIASWRAQVVHVGSRFTSMLRDDAGCNRRWKGDEKQQVWAQCLRRSSSPECVICICCLFHL